MANNCYYEMRISGKPANVQTFLDVIQRKNEIEGFNIGAFLSATCYEDIRVISPKFSSVDICGDCKWSIWSASMNNGDEQGIIGASKKLSLCIEFYSQESGEELAEYGLICCGDVIDYNRVPFWENEILYSIIDSEYRKNDAQLASLSDEECIKKLEDMPLKEVIRIYEAATESIVPACGEYRYEDGYLTIGGFPEEVYYSDEEVTDMLITHRKNTETDFIQTLFDINVSPGNWCPPKIWNTVSLSDGRVLEFGLYREQDGLYTFQVFNNDDVVLCEPVLEENRGEQEKNDFPENAGKVPVSDFTGDPEKMRDFWQLSKSAFLMSYSYLTEAEYDATCIAAIGLILESDDSIPGKIGFTCLTCDNSFYDDDEKGNPILRCVEYTGKIVSEEAAACKDYN